MAAKHYVNAAGKYLGSFDGAPKPKNSTEVPQPPEHIAQVWDGAAWGPIPEKIIAQKELAESDRDVSRFAEDIFEALKAKGVLTDDDLPPEVIDKIQARKLAREKM